MSGPKRKTAGLFRTFPASAENPPSKHSTAELAEEDRRVRWYYEPSTERSSSGSVSDRRRVLCSDSGKRDAFDPVRPCFTVIHFATPPSQTWDGGKCRRATPLMHGRAGLFFLRSSLPRQHGSPRA